MKRSALIIFLLAAIFCCKGFALNWQEARLLAEKNNSELKSATKQVESSEWTYKKSWTTFLPQISGNASVSEGSATSTTSTGKTYSYGLTGSQYLFQGMAGIYGIQSAYADLEYKKASLALTKASVLYDLRSSYVEVMVAQENVKLLERILKQRQDNTALIQLRYDSGKEDKGNLMSTQADEAQAKYDLVSAKRDLKLAKLKLSQILQHEITSIEANETVGKTEQIDIVQSITTNPTYVMAKKTLETAELAQKAVVAEFLPSISLSGTYRKQGSDWPPVTSNKSWSLNFSLPLFPGGSNMADWAIYSAKLDQAKEDYTDSINDLRYSLEEAYENFNDAVEALAVNKISLAAAKERAMISRAKYLNGLTTYEYWDQTESSYIQAQKSLLTYEKNALLAEALWHKTYGGYVK